MQHFRTFERPDEDPNALPFSREKDKTWTRNKAFEILRNPMNREIFGLPEKKRTEGTQPLQVVKYHKHASSRFPKKPNIKESENRKFLFHRALLNEQSASSPCSPIRNLVSTITPQYETKQVLMECIHLQGPGNPIYPNELVQLLDRMFLQTKLQLEGGGNKYYLRVQSIWRDTKTYFNTSTVCSAENVRGVLFQLMGGTGAGKGGRYLRFLKEAEVPAGYLMRLPSIATARSNSTGDDKYGRFETAGNDLLSPEFTSGRGKATVSRSPLYTTDGNDGRCWRKKRNRYEYKSDEERSDSSRKKTRGGYSGQHRTGNDSRHRQGNNNTLCANRGGGNSVRKGKGRGSRISYGRGGW